MPDHGHGGHFEDLPPETGDSMASMPSHLSHEQVSADMKFTQDHHMLHKAPSSMGSHHSSMNMMMDHSMMPMMSIGFLNFPVAFFNISEIWQFVVLAIGCFLISFLVEFAKVRNALGSLSSVVENVLQRTNLRRSPVVKRYKEVGSTPTQKVQPDGLGLRKPSLENLNSGSDETNTGSKTQLQKMGDASDGRTVKLTKRRRLRRHHDTPRSSPSTAILSPSAHMPPPPPPVSPAFRLCQLLYHFAMVFSHYALMMAAMGNLWIMIFVCAGAAVGYMIGCWVNDRENARLYRCQTCLASSRAEEGSNSVPRIKVDKGTSDNNANEDSDDENDDDEGDGHKKSVYYGGLDDTGPAMRPIPPPQLAEQPSSGPYCH